jgi:hypothetical protein
VSVVAAAPSQAAAAAEGACMAAVEGGAPPVGSYDPFEIPC